MVGKSLTIHLDDEMLAPAQAGRFNFANRIMAAVEALGWQADLAPATTAPPPAGSYALHHMQGPAHPRVLIFRRCYYYPFWHIERLAQRWRWPVARARFVPAEIDREAARQFIHRLRQKELPGLRPAPPAHVLIALQGRLRQRRSFQATTPVEMLRAVAETGKRCIATLHPREDYSAGDLTELEQLCRAYPNLTIGRDSRALLPAAEYVVTQNSAVAMDAYLLARPVVLFGQVDFHHIALNVADLGVAEALARAPDHRADYARYLYWFLKLQAIDAGSEAAEAQILAAMKRGGWPI